MKKLKLFVTSVAILAVVGGALAFKSSSFANHKLYCQDATTLKCNFAVSGLTTTVTANPTITPCVGHPNQNLYANAPINTVGPCPLDARQPLTQAYLIGDLAP